MTSFHINRRHLLHMAAGAGVAMMDLPRFLRTAGAAEPKDEFGGLPVGIQSYSLRKFSVTEAVRHIQGMGLHYVEMYKDHFDPLGSPEETQKVLDLLAKADIKCNAHGVNEFTKNHEENRKQFEFAKRAGFRNITAYPTADSFDSLDKLCEEYKIRICIHNHGPDDPRYPRLADVTKAIKGRHPLIGSCLDTGHALRSDEDPVKWLHELGDRVFALHLKDVAERKDKTHSVVLGSAHLDVAGVFKALAKIKFPADGSLSLEYESNPENPIDDIKQSVAAAKEAIAKVQG